MYDKNNQKFQHLFTPLTVRNKVIPNRIVSSPHCGVGIYQTTGDLNFSSFTHIATQYYGAIARGGAGIVNTGHLAVDPRYYMSLNKDHFDFRKTPNVHDHQIPGMRMMTDMIHYYGALASIELNHGGRQAFPVEGNCVPGASFAELDGFYSGLKVIPLDKEEMDKIADYFAEAAFLGKRGGFDIINIHAGHSWLLGQFLSPLENKRTDKYGGSVENRARFPLMVLQRIREKVGNDTIIEIRFSANEMVKGGITLEDAIETVQILQEPIDIVQCSAGKINNITSDVYMFPMNYMQHGCNAYLAREMRKHVDVLVETVGGINEPEQADGFIADGTADLVAMARSFIADPNWGEKARLGHSEDIRPCIRCLRCMNYHYPPHNRGTSECTVNPRRTMPIPLSESEMTRVPFQPKKVAVVGGGPAGMQAAYELARKGHNVTLYEKSDVLGGRLSFADHVSFKQDIRRYRQYLETQMKKFDNITVKLSSAVTPQALAALDYDAVVVAAGAAPFIPPISGADKKNVFHACDVFGHEDKLGEKVVVVGGGFVGCEMAVHLQGKGKHVDVVEVRDELMADSKDLPKERFLTLFYMEHEYTGENVILSEAKTTDRVRPFLNTQCVEITDKGVVVSKDGEKQLLEADSVIMATSFRPDKALKEQFDGCAPTVLFIGDCDHVGSLWNTSRGGYSAALKI